MSQAGSLFLWKTAELKGETFAVITGHKGDPRDLVVPEAVDGIPVREIAPHAFENRLRLESVALPKSVVRVGAFAFHSCRSLKKIDLTEYAVDCHDGAFRGCDAVRLIIYRISSGNFRVMRDLLTSAERRMHFRILDERDGSSADLVFPGYVREDQEDTFARVIHFSLEGVGFAYRECVSRSGIDYAAYDRLFSRIDYAYGTDAAAIAMHRLRTPRSMGEAAGTRYRSFLEKYVDQTLRDLVRRGDAEGIELLRDEVRIPETERAAAMVYASEQGQTECAALLASMRVADEETQAPCKKTENEDNPPRSSTTAGMLDLEEW
ncbi:MAG: leucine-rich repeat protein [Lachnospiraceae bacterium]|nr:leucine-rich repeat protein [Lachnospiraceae bacterium]